ncbi:MAG: ATP-dependent DNA ligase [Verrucomicrobiales bacterium]|nr:ATP-dependent DNA ligase [Verrucomicrobiales bacterium]
MRRDPKKEKSRFALSSAIVPISNVTCHVPENTTSAPEFSFRVERGDPELPELGLWLDPHRPRDFAFVSHAHADHFAPHGKTLCSAATRKLVESRFRQSNGNFLSLDFGERRILEGGYEVELLPAGHIPGSAMLHLTRLEDGATLLHTGDFKTRPALGAEFNRPREADTLIMETTFGLPKFRLPPSQVVLAEMTKYARETIEDGEVPIFMAYSLGKAQEILLSLHANAPELLFQVHSSVAKMNEAVGSLGYELPPCEIFNPKERSSVGHVVVMPPSAGRSRAVRQMKRTARLAMVSGWGMDSGAKYRYQCDEVFPLSDHAGYDDLHTFVDEVKPERVYTIHGYCNEFASDLRERGIEAWPLAGETQLELELATNSTGLSARPNPLESARPDSEFADFTEVCESIAATTGKVRKQEILAGYLFRAEPETLVLATSYFSGKAFSRASGVRATSVGWALIRQALLDVTGLTLAQYRQVSSTQADAARTAYLILQGKTVPEAHTMVQVADAFSDLASAKGQTEKVRLLRALFVSFHHSESSVLIGILLGDLRIGLKEGLLEESLAIAFDRPVSAIRGANMLLGDIGQTALFAKEDRLSEAEATWFTPLKVMLASPEETAEDIVARHGGKGVPVWLEDKFDGIRAQLHRRGDEVELYSRDLRVISTEFSDLIEPARQLDRDVILDGEIIAFAEGKKLTFFDLQKRLGRRDRRLDQGDLFFGEAVPVRFIAFDLLGIDGKGCLDLPLRERRALLDSIVFPGRINCCEVFQATTAEEIDEAFNEARRRDNEGLIAKDPTSTYSPGRRGKQWLKLKKAMPTLDVVVVKAQQGHGKRSHVLSDYTFSVRDEASGELRVIGKAYSGLTDEEIEGLTSHFKERTIEKNRNVHTVEPDTVLEIAFDSINPSKRHDSGLALRFPRIKAIRRDKGLEEIDTLEYARKLAGVRSES